MYKNIEKIEFIKSLFDNFSPNANSDCIQKEIMQFLLNNTYNGRLYKYRSFNENSILNLREGTLYCALPSSFNDPFDSQVGIDLHTYFSTKMEQALAPIDDYFGKFLQVYERRMPLEVCTERERKVFKQWLQSPNLMKFLKTQQTKKLDEAKTGAILLNNFYIVIEIILGFMCDNKLKDQMADVLAMMPGLIKQMSREGKIKITEENASYEDFARSLGIDEDADEITLTKMMFQSQHPQEALIASKMDEDLARIDEEMRQEIDKMFRIGCLCTDNKNRLMWSHYAEGHKGFCIEYDFSCEMAEFASSFI